MELPFELTNVRAFTSCSRGISMIATVVPRLVTSWKLEKNFFELVRLPRASKQFPAPISPNFVGLPAIGSVMLNQRKSRDGDP